jgi:YVTN family beta-propeller protein
MTRPDDVAFENPAGTRIGPYLVEAEIGRGGMAVVYRAQEVALGRRVALKLMAAALARDESFRQRFVREAQLAASIDHPHVIPIFAAGEVEGRLFIAMRHVDGEDLRHLLRNQRLLPIPRGLPILAQVAAALDAAHANGLVHRDVKPANVLVDTAADTGGATDYAFLTDFGLTKKSMSLSGLTSVGQLVGSFDYIAPEQIESRPLDGKADQYALGCMAFEMLAGELPFPSDDDRALMFAHLFKSPPTLTECRPGLPVAADAVLTRAMAKAPAARYPTCGDFVDALTEALNGDRRTAADSPDDDVAGRETVTDRRGLAGDRGERPSPPGPERSEPRRRRRIILLVLIVLAALGAVAVPAYLARPGALGSAPQSAGQPTPAGTEPALGTALTTAVSGSAAVAPPVVKETTRATPAAAPALGPPAAGHAYVPDYKAGLITVLDTTRGVPVSDIPVGAVPFGAAVTRDGRRLVVSHRTGEVSIVDLASGTVSATFQAPGDHWDVGVSPDGGRAYLTDRGSGTVTVLDLRSGAVVATVPTTRAPGDSPVEIAMSPDGSRAYATNRGNGTVAVIDTESNAVVATVPVQGGPNGVAVTPDGSRVFVTNEGSGTVSVISTQADQVVDTIGVGQAPITAVVSDSGRRVYVVNRGSKTVSVINPATGAVMSTIDVGGDPAGLTVASDTGEILVANGGTDSVSVIDPRSYTVVRTIGVGRGPTSVAVLSAGG